MQLTGKKILLRPTLPVDANLIYYWENDKDNQPVSGNKEQFKKKEIEDFIANQKDIYLDKQLRLMISLPPAANEINNDSITVGCIDLFEFNKRSLKAGIGILIEKKYRKNGYGTDALAQLIQYCFQIINLKELYCNISEENEISLKLFRKHHFKIVNKKKNIYSLRLLNE